MFYFLIKLNFSHHLQPPPLDMAHTVFDIDPRPGRVSGPDVERGALVSGPHAGGPLPAAGGDGEARVAPAVPGVHEGHGPAGREGTAAYGARAEGLPEAGRGCGHFPGVWGGRGRGISKKFRDCGTGLRLGTNCMH